MKKPLTVEEQVDYLENNKNVVYNNTKKEVAMEFLLTNNYTDVITPYKYLFHYLNDKSANEYKTGKEYIYRDRAIFKSYKENNKHYYPNEIDFTEYIEQFNNDRNTSDTIIVPIINFERIFKAVCSYHFLLYGNEGKSFTDETEVKNYLSKLKLKLEYNQIEIKGRSNRKMQSAVDALSNSITEYGVYCGLDDMSFSTIQTLFQTFDNPLKKQIFQDMKNRGQDIGSNQLTDFEYKLFNLIGIRNVVVHGNSLEIHLRYKNRGQIYEGKLRSKDERFKIQQVIDWLMNKA